MNVAISRRFTSAKEFRDTGFRVLKATRLYSQRLYAALEIILEQPIKQAIVLL
jgi:hypothetical protein